MSMPDIYFVDLHIIYQIFSKNIWYIFKLLMMAYVMFYWVPTRVFPQDYTGDGIKKIVFNFVYMIAYVEIVYTFLVFIKIFNILLFIFLLFVTKLLFMKFQYGTNIIQYLRRQRTLIMLWILDAFDKRSELQREFIEKLQLKLQIIQKNVTLYTVLKTILFFLIFFYVIVVLSARGMTSYANPVSDTSQYMEWVVYIKENVLFSDIKTFGANFYGISILIAFVSTFTNIDPIILFSIYPILLLIALYFSIYYVIKEFSGTKYVGLVAVLFHGLVLMSPVSNFFLGKILSTSSPVLYDLFGLKFYLPRAAQVIRDAYEIGFIPFTRYTAGMAYEHSSIFVWLNIFFLIKSLDTGSNRYLHIYFLTLMLVFTFHGGGAFILIIVSVFIAINSIFFGRVNLKLLKKGLKAIGSAAILGNMWILSMLKYGVPPEVGASAPFLDKILKTRGMYSGPSVSNRIKLDFESVTLVDIQPIHLIVAGLMIIALVWSYFTKKRFIKSSFMIAAFVIIFIYFMPNLGFPMIAKHTRLAEYFFLALTILFSFYFLYLVNPIILILKKNSKYVLVTISYAIFIGSVLVFPRWMDEKAFYKSLNAIEYTSIPDIILKIDKEEQPYTWTVVSYVQAFTKVRNKGYHVNTQNFLMRYDPNKKYLPIPTPKIYIFVENSAHPYKGLKQWYYRWRGKIQENLRSWVAQYKRTHNNIKVYDSTGTVTVYEIDNSEYMEYYTKLNEEKAKNEKKDKK